MERILVTGSSGRVGAAVTAAIEEAGWSVQRFDLVDGDDLRDQHSVRAAVEGCDAIVHAGAIAHDTAGTSAEIMATNLLGTWHVLAASEFHRVDRVVYFSSGQVFGCAEGERPPAYLPIDDDHPLRAARPYGMSKRLAEEMCAMWTARTGISTIILRPVLILGDEALTRIGEDQAELGAFVHVDDVANAVLRALTVDFTGHIRMTLCGPGRFDTALARRMLSWQPTRSWPSRP